MAKLKKQYDAVIVSYTEDEACAVLVSLGQFIDLLKDAQGVLSGALKEMDHS